MSGLTMRSWRRGSESSGRSSGQATGNSATPRIHFVWSQSPLMWARDGCSPEPNQLFVGECAEQWFSVLDMSKIVSIAADQSTRSHLRVCSRGAAGVRHARPARLHHLLAHSPALT